MDGGWVNVGVVRVVDKRKEGWMNGQGRALWRDRLLKLRALITHLQITPSPRTILAFPCLPPTNLSHYSQHSPTLLLRLL